MEESFAVFRREQFEPGRERRVTRLIGIALAVVTLAVFSISFRSGLIYDARLQILTDTYIHQPSHLAEVLSFRVMGRDVLDFNRPVHLASLMFDSILWGKNPLGYHLTSILLHAINALLLFGLIQSTLERIGTRKGRSEPLRLSRVAGAFGALFFALHPVCVEAVAEVSYREDVLTAFFILLSLHLARKYLDAVGSGGGLVRRLIPGSLCVLSVLAACGSKETGVVAPALVGIYLLLFPSAPPVEALASRRAGWRGYAPVALLVCAAALVAGGFIAARFLMEPKVSEIFVSKPPAIGTPRQLILGIMPPIWAVYLKNIILPSGLTGDYRPESIYWMPKATAIAVVVASLLAIGLFGARNRAVLLGGAMFWLLLLPASNFLPMYRPAADRYMYAPMLGAALIAASLIHWLWDRSSWSGIAVGTICIIIVIAMGIGSAMRQLVFRNSRTFWADTAAKTFSFETSWSGLGTAYLEDLPFPYDGTAPPVAKSETDAALDAFEALADRARLRGYPAGHLWLKPEQPREFADRFSRNRVGNRLVQIMPEPIALRLGIAMHAFDILHSTVPPRPADDNRPPGHADGHLGAAMVLEIWAQALDKAGLPQEATQRRAQADAAYLRSVRLNPRHGEPDRMMAGLSWEKWQADWANIIANRNRATIEQIWKELKYTPKQWKALQPP